MKHSESVLCMCITIIAVTFMLCIRQCDKDNNDLYLEKLKIEKEMKGI